MNIELSGSKEREQEDKTTRDHRDLRNRITAQRRDSFTSSAMAFYARASGGVIMTLIRVIMTLGRDTAQLSLGAEFRFNNNNNNRKLVPPSETLPPP